MCIVPQTVRAAAAAVKAFSDAGPGVRPGGSLRCFSFGFPCEKGRRCSRSAAFLFLIARSSVFLRWRRFFRDFPPFLGPYVKLDRPVCLLMFFLHSKPRTPRNHWKTSFGRVAKATYVGIFPCLPWATGRWRPGGAGSRRIGHTSSVDRTNIERGVRYVKDYYRKKGNIFEGRPAGSPLPQTPPPPVIPTTRHSDRSRPKGGVVEESGRCRAAGAGPSLGPASVAGRISPLRLRSGQAAALRSK